MREYKEKDRILIFDEVQDEQLSTYDPRHLEELVKAESYHFWFTTRRDKVCSIFNNHVGKECRILEIGGGTGFIAERLQQLGFNIELSDCASNGLAYARERGIEKLYQFDLFNPPFQEAFDVICLFDVLEHLNDDHQALEMLKKMLKPGGKIILTVPAHQWLWNRDDTLAGHKRRYTKKQLELVFKSAGLQPLYLRYFFIMILPFLVLRKWIKKDDSQAHSNEKIDFRIPSYANKFFYFLTKIEFQLDWLLPNIMGGSLIGIAQKK